MKTVIGAGILTLPYTVSKLGYVFGMFIFVFMISLVQFATITLLKSKNLSRHSNYSTIAFHIFRTKFAQVICNFFILMTNVGACIA
jgi:amino acid permease